MAGSDCQCASGTLTFAAGETEKRFDIVITHDSSVEGDETFDVAFASSDGTVQDSTHEVTIDDIPPIIVRLSPAIGAMVAEGAGKYDFQVELAADPPITGNVSVRCVTYSRTAAFGSDYSSPGPTLTFVPGEATSQPCSITIIDDSLDEYEEFLLVGLIGPTGGAAIDGPSSSGVRLTIGDNDDPPAVTLSPTRVGEEDGNVTFTATLSEASGREAKVLYATGSGTATEGTDFETAQGELTFAKGDTAETFMIDITNDSLQEGVETADPRSDTCRRDAPMRFRP